MAGNRGRGGRRQGAPGVAYQNRTDLMQVQNRAPDPTTTSPPSPVRPQVQPAAPPRQPPTPLLAPTERPGEPLTAGMSRGPGPGVDALTRSAAPADPGSDIEAQLVALYKTSPNPDLLHLLRVTRARQTRPF